MRSSERTAITGLAVVTRAVEYGFIAAGVTVATIAAFQSLGIVVSWIAAGG